VAKSSSVCASCGSQLPADAKFCAECGAAVRTPCPACGAQRTAGARFCAECGARFDDGSSAGPAAVPAPQVTPAVAPIAAPISAPIAAPAEVTPVATASPGLRFASQPRTSLARQPGTNAFLAIAAVVVLVVAAFGTGFVKLPGSGTTVWPLGSADGPDAPPAQGHLTLGSSSTVEEIPLDADGASVTVSAPGKPWHGLEMDVPAGAWTGTTLQITAQQIIGSTFGKLVTPISPLYTVTGAEGLAAEPVTLTIPVTVPDGSFAMGFFYDASGRLEGMPLLAEDGTSVTIATEHFSSFFVSMIERMLLPEKTDSGFLPGVDDWLFTNRGSFVAPSGHCAGQTLTEAWYFIERYRKAGAPRLHNVYDNNGNEKTPDLWQDDSLSYRLASVAHTQYVANAGPLSLDKFFGVWRGLGFDTLQYDAFRYAMSVTGEPQLVSLSDSNNKNGHAMLVYRVDPNGLHVADPNYPSATERLIPFDGSSGKFKTYSSGANYEAIRAGHDIAYVNFVYKAKTALVDWSVLGADWAALDAGTIGAGVFPTLNLQVFAGTDAAGKQTWVSLVDGYTTSSPQLEIVLTGRGDVDDTRLSVYAGTSSTPAAEGDLTVTVALHAGPNPLGILESVYVEDPSNPGWLIAKYVDFVRITVNLAPRTSDVPAPSFSGPHSGD
jgi:hypothetical protein